MFFAPKAKRQVHELKTMEERSDEGTEAMPAERVRLFLHRFASFET